MTTHARWTAAEYREYQRTGREPGEVAASPVEQRRARRADEQAIQRSIVQWLELALRPGVRFWHTPNGGQRSAVEAAIFKGLGVRPGIPDLLITWPAGRLPLAFIEVKTGRGLLTPAQREFRSWCLDNAVPWVMVRSLDEAMTCVREWGLTSTPRAAQARTEGD